MDSYIGRALMNIGAQLPEDARNRREAKSKDELNRLAYERLKKQDEADALKFKFDQEDRTAKLANEKAVSDQTMKARTALDTTNTAWLDNVAKSRDSALDTANLAKEQAVTDNYGKLRTLPAGQSGTGLKILESGVGEAAKNDSISKYKEPGEVDRFRYMSQKLTPFSGNKEVDTALGNAQATAKMEQDSAERQAARDATEQAQADRERAADERLDRRLNQEDKSTQLKAEESARKAAMSGIDPETGRPYTQTQSMAATYALRMSEAEDVLDQLQKEGFDPSSVKAAIINPKKLDALKDPKQQRYAQAMRNFVNATLRRESGAAISPSEFDNANAQYFATFNNSPEVLAQKRDNRLQTFSGFKAESGGAFQRAVDTYRNEKATRGTGSLVSPVKTVDAQTKTVNGVTYKKVSGGWQPQ